MHDAMERFRQVFFEEAHEAIEGIEQHILQFSETPITDDVTDDIFRAAHSIKGGAATFGMEVLANFTHLMETLLDQVRAKQLEFSEPVVDCLLLCVDVSRDIIHHYESDSEIDHSRRLQVEQQLQQLNNSSLSANSTFSDTIVSAHCWQISLVPEPSIMHSGNDPLRYIQQCMKLAQVTVRCDVSELPEWQLHEPTYLSLRWQLTLTNQQKEISKAELEDIFLWIDDQCELSFTAVPTEQMVMGSATPKQSDSDFVEADVTTALAMVDEPEAAQTAITNTTGELPQNTRKQTSIRVELDKVDDLINLVGELVITQSMLSLCKDEQYAVQGERLATGLAQLQHHTREIQQSVMRIRMLPISFCFNRFPRVVRDMGRQLGKQVELTIVGETTEVDKTVIEELTDPLVHLVRNSLDHGIESPEQRVQNGKAADGKLVLRAFHQVGNIIIEVIDDGAGLHRDKIYQKAVALKLIDPTKEYTDQEIFDLIFLAGFSTAEKVSDISGRGVGMDVVRRNIQALNGSIDVRSQVNQGTTFTIRLPLTLAILDGQLVRIHQHTYVVPLLSIIESIQVRERDITVIDDQDVSFKWRDEQIPLVKCGALFGLQENHEKVSDGLVVVVESEGRKCGLYVNELLSHQQVVVKSLEENYQKVEGVSGATILGDGAVALILDIPALLNSASEGSK